MLNEMNELAASILSSYRRRSDIPILPFSELVKMKIEQVESVKFEKAEKRAPAGVSTAKMQQRAQLIEELRELTSMEVKAMSGTNLLIFADSRYVEDYQTEDKAGYFRSMPVMEACTWAATWKTWNIPQPGAVLSAFHQYHRAPLSAQRVYHHGAFTNNFESKGGKRSGRRWSFLVLPGGWTMLLFSSCIQRRRHRPGEPEMTAVGAESNSIEYLSSRLSD